MHGSSVLKGVLITVLVVAGLAALRYKPWQGASPGQPAADDRRARLAVGFLPVT
jgi:hypothetical protein